MSNSYEYATFFLEVHISTHILHGSPLNYSHISFQYPFAIQDALDFVIELLKRI